MPSIYAIILERKVPFSYYLNVVSTGTCRF